METHTLSCQRREPEMAKLLLTAACWSGFSHMTTVAAREAGSPRAQPQPGSLLPGRWGAGEGVDTGTRSTGGGKKRVEMTVRVIRSSSHIGAPGTTCSCPLMASAGLGCSECAVMGRRGDPLSKAPLDAHQGCQEAETGCGMVHVGARVCIYGHGCMLVCTCMCPCRCVPVHRCLCVDVGAGLRHFPGSGACGRTPCSSPT